MKIQIVTKEKESDMILNCKSIKVKDGLFVIQKPVFLDNHSKTEEVWIPVSSVYFVNILENAKENTGTK